MFNTRQALLKTIPCLSHGNTYLKHSHVLHMGIFVLLSQHLHDLFSRVLACTLLHRELQDYSLGQIAFAVFRALFAITQLLCHVSALLTSACKQA